MSKILIVHVPASKGESFLSSSSAVEMAKLFLEVGQFPKSQVEYYEIGKDLPYEVAKTKTEAKKNNLPLHNEIYTLPTITAMSEKLHAYASAIKPDTILLLGSTVTKIVLGLSAPESWKGSMLTFAGCKCMPLYSPGELFKQYHYRFVTINDLRKVVRHYGKPWPVSEERIQIPTDLASAVEMLDWLGSKLDNSEGPYPLAMDIETTRPLVTSIGFAWSAHDAISIPLETTGRKPFFSTWGEEYEIARRVRAILTHPKAYIIGQNYNYDKTFMAFAYGVFSRFSYDTMWAHHATGFTDLPKTLDFLSRLYLDHHVYWKDKSLHSGNTNYYEAWEYNARDCMRTFAIYEAQKDIAREFAHNLDYQFRREPYLWRTQLRGVRWNPTSAQKAIEKLQPQIKACEELLENFLPHEVYPRDPKATPYYRSPSQLATVLYKLMGFPVQSERSGESYAVSTGDASLTKLMELEPVFKPWFHALLSYRRLTKAMESYFLAEYDNDKRMRCSFDEAGTGTYRLASRKNILDTGLNLQTLPDGDKIEY